MLRHLSLLLLLSLTMACTPKSKVTQASAKGAELTEKERIAMTSLYIDAAKERMLGNLSESDRLLRRVLEIDPDNHAALYDRALLAANSGANSAALDMASRATELDPDNMWYQLLLAEIYIGQNEFNKAEDAYERLLQDHPDEVDYHYELSMIRYRKGDIPGSIKALDEIERVMGFSDELFQQKQLLYIESGNTSQAILELEEQIERNPTEPLFYGLMAEIYQSKGEPEKALEYYEKILAFDPGNGMVQMSLYEYYMNSGEDEKAREAILLGFEDEMIDIDTKVGILLNYYEMSETDPSKREEALLLCEKLIETYPGEAKSYAIYGDFLLREERYIDARKAFRDAVEIDPSRQIIWSQILAIDSQLQNYIAMAADSEEALELYPTEPSFYLLNGIANNQMDKPAEAIEVLEAGKEMVINNDLILLDFYSSLGDAYHQLKRYIDSDKAFDRALKIQPDNVYVLNNYSYYLSLRGSKLDKAETMALRANELSPNSASFQDTYAWVLYRNGKYTEALEWLDKALSNGGDGSGVIHEHRGDALYQLDRKEEAMDAWKVAKSKGDYSEELDQKISEGRLID